MFTLQDRPNAKRTSPTLSGLLVRFNDTRPATFRGASIPFRKRNAGRSVNNCAAGDPPDAVARPVRGRGGALIVFACAGRCEGSHCRADWRGAVFLRAALALASRCVLKGGNGGKSHRRRRDAIRHLPVRINPVSEAQCRKNRKQLRRSFAVFVIRKCSPFSRFQSFSGAPSILRFRNAEASALTCLRVPAVAEVLRVRLHTRLQKVYTGTR